MNREDIIRLAREAGYPDYAFGLASEAAWLQAERFAARAAEWGAKRERDRHTALMRQALEALVWEAGSEPALYAPQTHTAITALREALGEP